MPIDKKTKSNKNKIENTENVGKLAKSIAYIIIHVGIIILVGTATLYGCRVSQSNILPSDVNCYPYNETQLNKPEEIPISINVVYNSETHKKESEKITFPFDENIQNTKSSVIHFIKFISEKLHNSKTNNVLKYFLKVLQGSISNSIGLYNLFLNFINSTLSESFVIIFSQIIFLFLCIFIYIGNLFCTFYLWITNIFMVFGNSENEESLMSIFSNISNLFKYFTNWKNWVVIILCIIFFPLILVLLIITTVLIIVFTFVLPFFNILLSFILSCSMKAEKNGKKYNILNLFNDILYYKKSLLLAIFSFFFLQSSFSVYGSFALGIGIFVILILYFFTSVYKSPPFPKNISSISEDFTIAKKGACLEKSDKMKGGGCGSGCGSGGGGSKKNLKNKQKK